MPRNAYYPARESQQIVFLSNLYAKLPVHAEALGITNDQLKAILDDISYYLWVLQIWYPAIQKNALEATAYKVIIATGTPDQIRPRPVHVSFENIPDERPPGTLTRILNQIQRIKLADGYSESVGRDLGIIGSEKTAIHSDPQLTLKKDRIGDIECVIVSFIKHEHEGVVIESRTNNGEWERVGIAMHKPWYDERTSLSPGVPEVREYRLCWWDQDHANGDYSAVQKITVGL